MNTTPINKYFLVSLPRSGTKSLCRMVAQMDIPFKHVPANAFERLLRLNEIIFFADTPIFAPSVFTELAKNEAHKFIYIDRPVLEWVDSFERVKLDHSYMALHTDKIAPNCVNTVDRACLEEIFNNQDYSRDVAVAAHQAHYTAVNDNIPEDRLLHYTFSDGWEPLAAFMGREPPPDAPVPHINKNTMYDVI